MHLATTIVTSGSHGKPPSKAPNLSSKLPAAADKGYPAVAEMEFLQQEGIRTVISDSVSNRHRTNSKAKGNIWRQSARIFDGFRIARARARRCA